MLIDKISLEPNENVVTITHRHKFYIIIELSILLITALLPALLILLVKSQLSILPFNIFDYSIFLTYCYAVWLLMMWVAAFFTITDFYLDVLVVTDKRLIIANQKGFWRRSLSSFRLNRLQDINVEIDGILPTLLDFGTLHAETAGHSEEKFQMDNLPDPRGLKAKIMTAIDNQYRRN